MVSISVSDTPTYGVDINGRIYPHHLRKSLAPSPSKPSVSSLGRQEKTSAELLVESVCKRLPFADSECVDKHQLVDGYGESLRLLQHFHSEFDDLMKSLCRLNFSATHNGSLQKEHLDAEVARRLDAMYRHGDLKPIRINNAVDAELMARPTELVQQQLSRSLRQMTQDFIEKLFRTLDRLTDRNVTGVVEWTSHSTCKFHFFTESLEQTYDGACTKTTTREVGDYEHRKTIRREEGKHIHTRARHEHHLIDAKEHEISDPVVEIPKRIQPLVVSIPAWLRPVVRIVSGQQIREDIVEQERNEDRWLKEKVTHSEVQLRYDPALVIGEIVLTGWSESDLDVDRKRREQEQREIQDRKDAQTSRASMFLAVLVATLLEVIALGFTVFGAATSAAFVVVSATLTILGMLPAAIAIWLQVGTGTNTSANKLVEVLWLVCATFGVVAGVQFLAGGWALGNMGVGLAGIAGFAVGTVALFNTKRLKQAQAKG